MICLNKVCGLKFVLGYQCSTTKRDTLLGVPFRDGRGGRKKRRVVTSPTARAALRELGLRAGRARRKAPKLCRGVPFRGFGKIHHAFERFPRECKDAKYREVIPLSYPFFSSLFSACKKIFASIDKTACFMVYLLCQTSLYSF